MKHPAKYLYEKAVPDYEQLWEKGGAEVEKIEVDGRYEEVPFFDLDIASIRYEDNEPIIDHRGRPIGTYRSFSVETTDGIDRTARVYMPDDIHRSDLSNELYIHADTAWTTTITGHNDYAASSFVSRTGLPMIVVGAEHGTNGNGYPSELFRLPRTFRQSRSISLAKSAQSSQLIANELQQLHDLPTAMIKTGESRGAMLAAGHLPYAEHYGNTIPYIDVTAPCLPSRLFSERADFLRMASWPTSELIGTVALGVELNKQKILKRQMGTVALNPNFILSNLKGVGPALFSGEAGRFARWVPADIGRTALYISTFRNDTVSRPDVWRELYKYNPNVFIREHPGGSHMTLAHDEVLETKAVRFNAFQDQKKTGLPLTAQGFDTIINTRRKGERDHFYKQPVPQDSVA